MDAASAALLGAVLDALPGAPVARAHDPPRHGGRVRRRRRAPAARAAARAARSAARRCALAERLTEDAPLPPAVLALAAERSAGNPQFLRDLLASAAAGGGALSETIEAAATARIDRLDPHDRALVRRASVLGMSFHPRMLADVLDGAPAPDAALVASGSSDVFADDGDGWYRFRIGVLRDAAYAGLPFRTRRRLHAVAGARLERELGAPRRRAGRACSRCTSSSRATTRAPGATRASPASRRASRARTPTRPGSTARAIDAARGAGVGALELADALGRARRGARPQRPARGRAGRVPARAAARGGRRGPRRRRSCCDQTELADRAGDARQARARRGCARCARSRASPGAAAAGCRARRARRARARRASARAAATTRSGSARRRSPRARRRARSAPSRTPATCSTGRCTTPAAAPRRRTRRARSRSTSGSATSTARRPCSTTSAPSRSTRGDWREAVVLYRRAGNASAQAGDAVNAAFGDCNVGEVLVEQGRLTAADEALRRAMQVWGGSGYDSGVAYATALLGRAAVHQGRSEDGRGHAPARARQAPPARARAGGADGARRCSPRRSSSAATPSARCRTSRRCGRACSTRGSSRCSTACAAARSRSSASTAAARGGADRRRSQRARELGIDYDAAAALHVLAALGDGADPRAPRAGAASRARSGSGSASSGSPRRRRGRLRAAGARSDVGLAAHLRVDRAAGQPRDERDAVVQQPALLDARRRAR